MLNKERWCSTKNILMKPLLRLLSCQRQMTALAIQTGKRFSRRESSMQMQTIQYIAIKFHELILKNAIKLHRRIWDRKTEYKENTYLCITFKLTNIFTYKNIISIVSNGCLFCAMSIWLYGYYCRFQLRCFINCFYEIIALINKILACNIWTKHHRIAPAPSSDLRGYLYYLKSQWWRQV